MSESKPRVCPKCKNNPLTARSVSGPGEGGSVEIDICQNCRGVWLDWGEVGELHELKAFIPGGSGGIAWKRDLVNGSCGVCEQRPILERIPIGAYGVDRCPECLGLWFDGGELGPMLTDQGFDALLQALRANPPK